MNWLQEKAGFKSTEAASASKVHNLGVSFIVFQEAIGITCEDKQKMLFLIPVDFRLARYNMTFCFLWTVK